MLLLLPLAHTLVAYFLAPSSIILSPAESEWECTGGCKVIDGGRLRTLSAERHWLAASTRGASQRALFIMLHFRKIILIIKY